MVVILFIFLWGIDIWILDKLQLRYHTPLSIKSSQLSFIFATSILLATHFAFHVNLFSSSAIGLPFASEVAIYYCALVVIYWIPGVPGLETRNSFFRLVRLVFFPGGSITFPEVLLADAFTSISKVSVLLSCVLLSMGLMVLISSFSPGVKRFWSIFSENICGIFLDGRREAPS